MHRLSPRQIQALTRCISGEDPDAPSFAYRRWVDIEAFVSFTGAEYRPAPAGATRQGYVSAWLDGAQHVTAAGTSRLATDIEKIIVALLDRREFESEDDRDAALLRVNEILRGVPVEARVASDGTVQIASTHQTRSQRVLEEQIHTVFGQVVTDAALEPSRIHYAKAKRYLTAADPDFENAAKEAVSSVESLVKALTGENDYTRAIKKAAEVELIPRPIDELAIKLFAYRGNEPGVGHGSADAPNVTGDEAWLIFNLAGALGAYLVTALRVR